MMAGVLPKGRPGGRVRALTTRNKERSSAFSDPGIAADMNEGLLYRIISQQCGLPRLPVFHKKIEGSHTPSGWKVRTIHV